MLALTKVGWMSGIWTYRERFGQRRLTAQEQDMVLNAICTPLKFGAQSGGNFELAASLAMFSISHCVATSISTGHEVYVDGKEAENLKSPIEIIKLLVAVGPTQFAGHILCRVDLDETALCVIEPTEDGCLLQEVESGETPDDAATAMGAHLILPTDILEMQFA